MDSQSNPSQGDPSQPNPCLDIVFSAFGSASQSAELSSQKLIYAGGDAIEDAVPTTVNVDKTAIVATAEPLHDSTNVANNVEARQEAAKKIHEFGNSPRRTNAEPAGGNEDVGKQANELPAPLSDDVQPADDNKAVQGSVEAVPAASDDQAQPDGPVEEHSVRDAGGQAQQGVENAEVDQNAGALQEGEDAASAAARTAEDVAAEVVAAGPPVSDMHKDATLAAARIAEDDKDNVGAPAPPASDMDEDAALAAAKEVEDAHEVGAAASPGPDMDEDAALAAAKTAGDVADEVGAPASPASDMDEDAALAAAKEVEDAHEVGAAAPPGPDMDEDAALAAAKTAEDVAEEVGAPASPASEMDEEMMELLKEGTMQPQEEENVNPTRRLGRLKRLDAQRAAPAPTPEGMDTDAGPGPEPEAEDEPETLQPKKVIKKRITMRDIDKTFDDDFFNEEADEEEVGEGDEGGQKRKLSQKDGTPMDEGGCQNEEDEYVARMRRRGDKERVDSDAPAGSGDGEDSDADSQASGAMDIDENDDVVEKQRKLREFAQKDRIGKGAAPEIKPLSDILAKLKSRKEAVSAKARDSVKAAKPVAKAPDAPLDVSALMQKATALDKAPCWT
eukprot:gene301-1635_t